MSPSQKYEIFLQLVRQEATMAEAAEAWQVNRATIMRSRPLASLDRDGIGDRLVAEGRHAGVTERAAPPHAGVALQRRIWPLALSLGLRLDVVGEIRKRRREADDVSETGFGDTQ